MIQALQDISKAIKLDKDKASYYEIRAQVAYNVEEYQRCIQDATLALQLNPRMSSAFLGPQSRHIQH